LRKKYSLDITKSLKTGVVRLLILLINLSEESHRIGLDQMVFNRLKIILGCMDLIGKSLKAKIFNLLLYL
jgi:hypothetical protein